MQDIETSYNVHNGEHKKAILANPINKTKLIDPKLKKDKDSKIITNHIHNIHNKNVIEEKKNYVENFVSKLEKLQSLFYNIYSGNYDDIEEKNFYEDQMHIITNYLLEKTKSTEINSNFENKSLIFYFEKYYNKNITEYKIYEYQLNDILKHIVDNPKFDINITYNDDNILQYSLLNENEYFFNKLKEMPQFKKFF